MLSGSESHVKEKKRTKKENKKRGKPNKFTFHLLGDDTSPKISTKYLLSEIELVGMSSKHNFS